MFSFARIAKEFGWTHKEILGLTARQFFLYLRSIDKLEAYIQVLALEAASFPQMKKVDRERVGQRYVTIAEGTELTYKERINRAWSTLRARRKLDGRKRSNIASKT